MAGRSRAELAKYAENPYVRGYLDSLAFAEGTDKSGYGTFFGGETIEVKPGMQHPDIVKKGTSAAFGRYQFMPHTWGEASKALGLEDMTPGNQDVAALYLTDRRGVDLDRIAAGKIDESDLDKVAPEWASFPTLAGKSYYGQPVKPAAEILGIARRGGKPAPQVGAGGVPRSDGAPVASGADGGATPGDAALTSMLSDLEKQTAALVESTKPKPIEIPQTPAFAPFSSPDVAGPGGAQQPPANPLLTAFQAATGQPTPDAAPVGGTVAAPAPVDPAPQARAQARDRRARATQQFLSRDEGSGSAFGRLVGQQRFAGQGLMDFLSAPLPA
jgi:lysozyme